MPVELVVLETPPRSHATGKGKRGGGGRLAARRGPRPRAATAAIARPMGSSVVLPALGAPVAHGPPSPHLSVEPHGFVPRKDGSLEHRRSGFSATIAPDGTLAFRDKSLQWNGLGLQFDATDSLMRALGQDPYLADKLRIARETRPMRHAMVARHRISVAKDALESLPRRLRLLWQRSRPSERETLLYELWAECANTSDGRKARRIIEMFAKRNGIPLLPSR